MDAWTQLAVAWASFFCCLIEYQAGQYVPRCATSCGCWGWRTSRCGRVRRGVQLRQSMPRRRSWCRWPTSRCAGCWTLHTTSAPSSASGSWRSSRACRTSPTSPCCTCMRAWAGGEPAQSCAGCVSNYALASAACCWHLLWCGRWAQHSMRVVGLCNLHFMYCAAATSAQLWGIHCSGLLQHSWAIWEGQDAWNGYSIIGWCPPKLFGDPCLTDALHMCADPLRRGVERAAPPDDHGVAGGRSVLDWQVCSAACGRVLLLGHRGLLCFLASAGLRLLRASRGDIQVKLIIYVFTCWKLSITYIGVHFIGWRCNESSFSTLIIVW